MPNANRKGMPELLTFDYEKFTFKTSLEEIFTRSTEMGVPKLSQRTIKEYYSYIVGLLGWFATENDFLSVVISTKAKSILSESKVPDTQENKREANFKEFTHLQLSKLFSSSCYVVGRSRKVFSPADFWLPLIALFTGARGREISTVNSAGAFKLAAIKADMLARAKLKGAHVEAVTRSEINAERVFLCFSIR